jgi:PPOX class probable F420-dependent enzyme
MGEPRATALRMPAAYGIPEEGERLQWRWVAERLTSARNYWVCTVRADGRPHAAPVWALWLDEAIWFSTSEASQKGRNIARDQRVVVHLESGDETVIVEGEVVRERDRSALERFVEAYEAKYAWRIDPANDDYAAYVVRPRVVHAWTEAGFPRNATRFVL